MYKPNFCAECGAQVLRTKWRIWTSRRFCEMCARRFRKARFMSPLIIGAIVFFTGLAAGRFALHSSNSAPPPLIIERTSRAQKDAPHAVGNSNEAATSSALDSQTNPSAATKANGASYGKDATSSERLTDPDEIVSICGARTQKGTPCQRRVRGTGRCWQHKGLPAMLPASKLIVQG
jgi:hypothetical protein